MNLVTILKNELLSIVEENKTKHIRENKEAQQDYVDAVLVICQNNLDIAKYGAMNKFKDIKSIPPAPVSYEPDYNKVIRMLELSVDETVTLSEQEFSQLVLDEWNWKHMFNISNSNYKTLKGL